MLKIFSLFAVMTVIFIPRARSSETQATLKAPELRLFYSALQVFKKHGV
jgi:hypothetical protein